MCPFSQNKHSRPKCTVTVSSTIFEINFKALSRFKEGVFLRTFTSLVTAELVTQARRFILHDSLGDDSQLFFADSKTALSTGHVHSISNFNNAMNLHNATHWTPNTYQLANHSHANANLTTVNTIVIDLDFHDRAKPSWTTFNFNHLFISKMIQPNLILDTPRGFQAYYVLRQPCFINSNTDLKQVRTQIDQLYQLVSAEYPDLDLGCNRLGFFRIPTRQNLLYFDQTSLLDLNNVTTLIKQLEAESLLICQKDHRDDGLFEITSNASKPSTTKPNAPKRPTSALSHTTSRQIDAAWYQAAIQFHQVPKGGTALGASRHNYLFTLALANYSSNIDEDHAQIRLRHWNQQNLDPLPDVEVTKTIHAAYSGAYLGASQTFIDLIVEPYGLKIEQTPAHWYKFKKSREERTYSHVSEWASDVLAYITQNATNGILKASKRKLMDALNISSASLTKALKLLKSTNKLITQTTYGSQGYTIYKTTHQLITETIATKKQRQLQYVLYLNQPTVNTPTPVWTTTDNQLPSSVSYRDHIKT